MEYSLKEKVSQNRKKLPKILFFLIKSEKLNQSEIMNVIAAKLKNLFVVQFLWFIAGFYNKVKHLEDGGSLIR